MKKLKHLIIFALVATPALGLTTSHTGADQSPVNSLEEVQRVLKKIVTYAQIFFYIIAVLYVILAAYDFLRSEGDAEKVKTARRRIIYSGIAIATALVAGGVVSIVQNFLEP